MNKLQRLLGIGTIALASLVGCAPCPEIEKIADVTGDGRPDVVLMLRSRRLFVDDYRWIAVQKEDGTFDEATAESPDHGDNMSNHFLGEREYFFDGEIYREAKKPVSK